MYLKCCNIMEINNDAILNFIIIVLTKINICSVIGYMCLIPTPSPITDPLKYSGWLLLWYYSYKFAIVL